MSIVFGIDGCSLAASRSKSARFRRPSLMRNAASKRTRTFYVSPGGENTNPGTREKPWASPGYGARQLCPGDTLVIMGGRYELRLNDEDIIAPPSGNANAWVTVKGEARNRPVLAGSNDLHAAVDLSDRSYIKVENLEITSDKSAGFKDGIAALHALASHIILRNLYIHHMDETGVYIGDVDSLQILNSKITHCGSGSIAGSSEGHGGWRNVLIRGCDLSHAGHYYLGGPGPGLSDFPDGLSIESSAGPVEVVDTVIEHNRGDGLDSQAANTYIRDCTIGNNSCDGVKLCGNNSKIKNSLIYGTGDGVGSSSPWAGIVIDRVEQANAYFEIINVTVQDNPEREARPVYAQRHSTVPITLLMRNTIVANSYELVYIGDSVRFIAEYNIFFRPNQVIQVHANRRDYAAGQLMKLGKGNLSKDPLFVSPAWGKSGDYHVLPGSPAIDAGVATDAPSRDLQGTSRPRGSGFDIGVFEQ